MRIYYPQKATPRSASFRRGKEGMAVIVVIVILSILLIYIAGNLRALARLGGEVHRIEQKQIHRLETKSQVTNSIQNVSTNYTSPRPPQ